jgi:hypothetical protein
MAPTLCRTCTCKPSQTEASSTRNMKQPKEEQTSGAKRCEDTQTHWINQANGEERRKRYTCACRILNAEQEGLLTGWSNPGRAQRPSDRIRGWACPPAHREHTQLGRRTDDRAERKANGSTKSSVIRTANDGRYHLLLVVPYPEVAGPRREQALPVLPFALRNKRSTRRSDQPTRNPAHQGCYDTGEHKASREG